MNCFVTFHEHIMIRQGNNTAESTLFLHITPALYAVNVT